MCRMHGQIGRSAWWFGVGYPGHQALSRPRLDTMDGDDDARIDALRAGGAGVPPGSGSAVRVLLAEEERTVRETLAALLSLEDDIAVVAQVASGDCVIPRRGLAAG